MTDQLPDRPWWAALLTSALTTLFGLCMIIITVVWVRPALDPTDSEIWIGLVIGGASLAGVGGSLLGRTGQRGSSTLGLLGAVVVVAVAAVLLSQSGCGLLGPVQVAAEREITWQRRPGPTCYVRTLADGELATETTAPFSCVPPPEFCAQGPGEPGYVTPVSGAAP